jgi:hypothetical protein
MGDDEARASAWSDADGNPLRFIALLVARGLHIPGRSWPTPEQVGYAPTHRRPDAVEVALAVHPGQR